MKAEKLLQGGSEVEMGCDCVEIRAAGGGSDVAEVNVAPLWTAKGGLLKNVGFLSAVVVARFAALFRLRDGGGGVEIGGC